MTSRGSYTVEIKRSAVKDMEALPARAFARVVSAVLDLETDPRPRGCKKLRGTDEFRLHVGPYRVLYVVDDEQRRVEIVAVGHRREIYRDM